MMQYKLFGHSGLKVSELALGTMTFGEDWGWGASEKESQKIFDLFVEAGGNFIDTACNYTNGTSEKYVGKFVTAGRDRFVVATKYTLSMDHDDPNAGGNHRKNMVRTLEGSLKNMGTGYVDILYLHVWDFTTPIDEILRGLDDLVRSGKVLYIAISDTLAWVVSQANTMAELRGWSRFAGLQIQYNLVQRSAERDLLPMAKAHDMTVAAWGILGAGVLSGKYKPDSQHSRGNTAILNERNFAVVDLIKEVAAEVGCSPSQVAINWLRQNSRARIIPILGARTADQIKDNLESLKFKLEEEQVKKLEEATKIELGFPHDFIGSERVGKLIYGNVYDKIDKHRQ